MATKKLYRISTVIDNYLWDFFVFDTRKKALEICKRKAKTWNSKYEWSEEFAYRYIPEEYGNRKMLVSINDCTAEEMFQTQSIPKEFQAVK